MSFWYNGGIRRQNDIETRDEIDKTVKDKFMRFYNLLDDGKIDHWKNHRDGRLALTLLRDHYAKSCFRGTPDAYKYEKQAIH